MRQHIIPLSFLFPFLILSLFGLNQVMNNLVETAIACVTRLVETGTGYWSGMDGPTTQERSMSMAR